MDIPIVGKLLVVEPDAALRRVIVRHLELRGHNVTSISCLEDSPTLDTEQFFSLLLLALDLSMPDSLGLLGLWRKHCPRAQILLLVEAGELKALNKHADSVGGVVVKPFVFDTLLKEVGRLLR